jgi:SNF2 family DNA or RNA helicase
MVMKKSSVNNFLKRKLKDYRFLKKISPDDIEKEVYDLRQERNKYFKFKIKPYFHQYVSFYIGICLNSFLFYLDMGLGKTKIILDIISFRKINKTLVIVPNDINIEGWVEEIKIHSYGKIPIPLLGSTDNKLKLLNEPGDYYIVSYLGLMHLVCTAKKQKGKDSKKLTINESKFKKVILKFDCVVWDEIHLIKNYKSLYFRVSRKIAKKVKYKYGATGTPFGRDPLDFWAQFYVIDLGETLGDTVGLFKESFFIQEETYAGFMKHVFDFSKMKKLNKLIQNRSIRFSDKEVKDTPKVIHKRVPLAFTKTAEEHYGNALQGIIKSVGDYKELESSFIKLRQISAGFITLKNDDGKKSYIQFNDIPKAILLDQYINSIPEKAKMIIFCEYVESSEIIKSVLKKNKIKFATATGKTKDSIAEIKKFKYDKDYRFLVGNMSSINAGGNLQVADYGFFYDIPISPIIHKQCIKRIARGNKKRAYIIYPIMSCKGSVENKILGYLIEGKNLFDSIVEGKKSIKDILLGQ